MFNSENKEDSLTLSGDPLVVIAEAYIAQAHGESAIVSPLDPAESVQISTALGKGEGLTQTLSGVCLMLLPVLAVRAAISLGRIASGHPDDPLSALSSVEQIFVSAGLIFGGVLAGRSSETAKQELGTMRKAAEIITKNNERPACAIPKLLPEVRPDDPRRANMVAKRFDC